MGNSISKFAHGPLEIGQNLVGGYPKWSCVPSPTVCKVPSNGLFSILFSLYL